MIRKDPVARKLLEQEDRNTLWTTKYFPTNRNGIPLFKKAQIEKFETLLNSCMHRLPGSPKVIVITGPVGCGKTTLVRVLCNEKKISILDFSPDDGYAAKDRPDDESAFISKLGLFLERSQLVTNPSARQILLIDDLTINSEDTNKFFEMIERYNSDNRPLFPLIWVADQNDTRKKINNCYYFNFPAASNSVLKRVINRVAKGQHISLDKSQIESLLAENPGDVRLAVNMLQFARTFVTGKYDNLSYFQAIGEILYQKNKRSSEDILRISHCSPQLMINGLFENYPDFFNNVSDNADAADSLSVADTFMEVAWMVPELADVAATTAMRGVLTANTERVPNTFFDMRPGYKSRLKNVIKSDIYHLEHIISAIKNEITGNNYNENSNNDDNELLAFQCFPMQFWDSNSLTMDSYLFQNVASIGREKGNQQTQKKESNVFNEKELCEALELLSIDPIDNDDGFFD
ncbi:hypothetical protein TRFO_39595 [Tritrichomonas foetus]|uniref:AAA+ ATPase domain-containing protein n=1 Tax=Tritrichomonas foetus TaxID=1144522 RepID=A0A1J4J7I5_9EUKA|nr:hypothetical protein TRFO_39595 [Tritrichomonas foetus]|eukprot:OHS94175.1 hypothetical protein TRFO_39595 [Tritrichomonas foetus]